MERPKILLVEDSITMLTLMNTALQNVGYEVDVATEGNEALHKIVVMRPHCLILDIILPGMNGYAVCRQVRVRDPGHSLPIVFISTKNTDIDRTYGLSLGADQYLAKPFTQEMLVQTVWNLLPVNLRPVQVSQAQQPDMRFANLIPRRRGDPSLLTTRNPFANTVRMDSSTYRLYLAIDGRKTVKTLWETIGVDTQKIAELLKMLVKQQLIELYDPEKRRLVVSLLDYL